SSFPPPVMIGSRAIVSSLMRRASECESTESIRPGSSCDRPNHEYSFLFIDIGLDSKSIHIEKNSHCSVRDALIPVYETVITRQRECQRGGLLLNRWIEIITIKRHLRLSNG